LSHEVHHHINNIVKKLYDKQRDVISRMPDVYKTADSVGVLRASGELNYNHPNYAEHRKRWPVYHALWTYVEGPNAARLANEDGVTGYTKSYWDAWRAGHTLPWGQWTAVDETLADIGRLDSEGMLATIKPVWKSYYTANKRMYKKYGKDAYSKGWWKI